MLDIQNLTLKYGQSQILNDMSLSAKAGKVTAVMGTNGVLQVPRVDSHCSSYEGRVLFQSRRAPLQRAAPRRPASRQPSTARGRPRRRPRDPRAAPADA